MSKRSYMLTDEQLNILDGLVQYLTTPECVKAAIARIGHNFYRTSELDNMIDEKVTSLEAVLRINIAKAIKIDPHDCRLEGVVSGALQDFAILFGTWESVRIGRWAIRSRSAYDTSKSIGCLTSQEMVFIKEIKSAISHIGDSIGFQIEEAREEPEDENEKEEGGAK